MKTDEQETDQSNTQKVQPFGFGMQVAGGHYTDFVIQPLWFCGINNIPTCPANIIKYVMRHQDKNGVDDLLKALDYCVKWQIIDLAQRTTCVDVSKWDKSISMDAFIKRNGVKHVVERVLRQLNECNGHGGTIPKLRTELLALLKYEYGQQAYDRTVERCAHMSTRKNPFMATELWEGLYND